MLNQNYFILYLLIANCPVYGAAKLWFKSFKTCDPNSKYEATYNITFKTIADKQYADGTITLTLPIDNVLRSNCTVDTKIGKDYVRTLMLNEKRKCDSLNKFLGEFLYDLERSAQIIPITCPIEKGVYRLHNALLNVEKIATVNIFPFGSLRFTDLVYGAGNDVYSCVVFEVEIHT